MSRVVVVGSTGQLGSDLVERLRQTGLHVVVPLSHHEIECTDPGSVARVLRSLGPDVVINAAGYVRVDEAEERPEEAFRVNAYGALFVARTCAELGSACVYLSTDYVFGGEKDGPYTEDDAPCPINVYGASKLAGEHLTRQSAERSLIVRLASLFGKSGARGKGGNFVETVLERARRAERLRIVADVQMSPTYAADAAVVVERLVNSGTTGVCHVTNSGTCSWYELARLALELAGIDANIEPVPSAEYRSKARRPRNSALATLRLDESEQPRAWQVALRSYLAERGHIAPLRHN